MRPTLLLLPVLLGLLCGPASAHRLVPNDGTHDDAETALDIAQPDVSQLVLHEFTAENPLLWITFHRKPGEEIYLQLGMPNLAGREGYRPKLALLAPWLPPATGLPFTVPEGFGARIVECQDESPDPFHEPFTGTDSFILDEESVLSEQDGPYYVVFFHSDGEAGKGWVALGAREVFGLSDIVSFADTVDTVRTFHEVDDEPLPPLTRALVGVSRVLNWLLSVFSFGRSLF